MQKVKVQGHMRPKIYVEAWRRHHSRPKGSSSFCSMKKISAWILNLEWWWAEKLAFNAHVFPKDVQISLKWVDGCSIHDGWWKLVPSINDSLWKEMITDSCNVTKLNYRRHTARCSMSLNISINHSGSFKVIENGTIRKLGYGFLIAFLSNHGRSLSCIISAI